MFPSPEYIDAPRRMKRTTKQWKGSSKTSHANIKSHSPWWRAWGESGPDHGGCILGDRQSGRLAGCPNSEKPLHMPLGGSLTFPPVSDVSLAAIHFEDLRPQATSTSANPPQSTQVPLNSPPRPDPADQVLAGKTSPSHRYGGQACPAHTRHSCSR